MKNAKVKVPIIRTLPSGKHQLTRYGKTLVICVSAIVLIALLLAISINALISYYYGLVNYVNVDEQSVLGDEEISKYLENMGDVDPSVTDSHNSDDIESDIKDQIGKLEKEQLEGVINIMLIGMDSSGVGGDSSSYADAKNTDTVIIVSINEKEKRIVLTSLMRDTGVQIQKQNGEKVFNKLNTAYIYGGYKELFNTVERNFGIVTDRFVQVNFSSFIDIVSIVGGVDIFVKEEEAIEMNNVMEGLNKVLGHGQNEDKLSDTSEGNKHLNGKQALAYARIRYVSGSDFGRTDRQRKLILAIAEKLGTLNIGQLNSLLTAILPKVSTNLTQGECTTLLSRAFEYLSYDMESMRIPSYGTYKDVVVSGRDLLWIDFFENYTSWTERVCGG